MNIEFHDEPDDAVYEPRVSVSFRCGRAHAILLGMPTMVMELSTDEAGRLMDSLSAALTLHRAVPTQVFTPLQQGPS